MDILLVDSSSDDIKLIRNSLKQIKNSSINVIESRSLKDALSQLERAQVQAILLNLELPDSQGPETCQSILSLYPRIPVILLANEIDDDITEKAILMGAQDCLLKTRLDKTILSKTISQAIHQRTTETALRESEQRFRYVTNATNDVLWDWNLETNHLWWGEGFYKVLGYPDSETQMHIDSWVEHLHPDDEERVTKGIHSAIDQKQESWSDEYRYYKKDGDIAHIMDRGYIAYDVKTGKAKRMIGAMMDITERKNAEQQIKDMRARYLALLNSSPAITYALDINNNFQCTFCSDNLYEMFSYEPKDIIDNPAFWLEHIHPHDRNIIKNNWSKQLNINNKGSFEYRFKDRHGKYHWIHDTFRLIYDEDHNPVEIVGSWSDITLYKTLSEELSYKEKHDLLTGLYNREEFLRQIELSINQSKENNEEHTLCYIDLDQFKVINDVCGYFAGDVLIKQVSETISIKLRHEDILARLGGDDFGIIFKSINVKKAFPMVDAILNEIRGINFDWQGKVFPIQCSIGLVSINTDSNDPQAVLNMADEACYLAKESGRNRIQIYNEKDAMLEDRQLEKQQISKIKSALENNRFILYSQKIHPLKLNGQGQHFEILVRMLDDDSNIIPPGLFLPAAEKYNLIQEIDKWIIEQTMTWLSNNQDIQEMTSTCSINLSGQSMNNPELIDHIKLLLNKYNVPPEKICFEVTETAALSNFSYSIDMINKLRKLGCRFALDDFGSGYTSFSYLQNLPADFLKIDGSFVKDIDQNEVSKAMVRSINEIGHVTGKKTIAEFVENDAISNVLLELDVDYAQGYGIGKPKPISEFNQ